MKPIVRITNQGFTTCPACSNFIKVAADVAETVCDFCQAELRVEVHKPRPTFGSRVLATGRGALIAGALVGVTALAPACGEDEEPEPDADAGMDTEVFNNDNNTTADYGVGPNNNANNAGDPDTGFDAEVIDNNNSSTNDYGAAPDNNGAAPDKP